MKNSKKLLLTTFILIIAVSVFGGCFSNKYYNLTLNKLSEVRYNLYEGENDQICVTLMSGKREEDYVINGYNTKLVDFGVLTFKVKNEDYAKFDKAKFVLLVGTKRYDGDLEKNPFDGSFVTDIGKIIDSNEQIFAKIMMGDFIGETTLANVNNSWTVNYEEALKIACKELKGQLDKFMENGEFAGEGYIKIINDLEAKINTYYWYVNFVNRKGENIAVIIDPNTKEILAKKTF